MPRKYIKKPKDQHKKTGPKGPMKPMDDTQFAQLVNMMRIHCTQDEICSVLDMSAQTLNLRVKERGYKNFRDCYHKHTAEGRVALRRMQWKTAEGGFWPAQKWIGQQELGQSEKHEQDNTSSDGSMAPVFINRTEQPPEGKKVHDP